MFPRLLSIFLDYKCNFSCEHCSVGSSPKISMPMPREIMVHGIMEFSKLPEAKVIGFTGGEATLSKENLLHGIELISKLNLTSRLVTNGWWAKNRQKARSFIKELKAAGLNELNTSYDQFHSPFMGVDPILNLVEEGLKQGLTVALSVVGSEESHFNGHKLKELIAERLGCEVKGLPKKFFLIEDRPAPIGSGSNLDVSKMEANSAIDLGCMEILKTLSLHPNGDLKACCGHTVFYSQDLILGNILRQKFSDIVKVSEKNIAYWLIHTLGPAKILEELGVEGKYSHICHACNVLLNQHREKFIIYLKDNKSKLFYEKIIMNGSVKSLAKQVIKNKEEVKKKVIDNQLHKA